MYSGIVEGIGTVIRLAHEADKSTIVIEAKSELLTELALGDSIDVNGVCLTITELSTNQFAANIVPETFRKTNLGELKVGSEVNLERALKQSARNGGHNVQGHVDGVGEISHIEADGQGALLVTIQVPVSLARYIVDKGFITIDGMSITVIKAETDFFTVTFIPYTQQATVVKHYRVGSKVNIEVDILAKYVEKLIRSQMNVREC